MRLLCPIIRVSRCIVNYIRHQFFVGHTVAFQFVRHDIPGLAITTPHKPPEKTFCCGAISASLQIDIDHFSILIHSTPQVLLLAIDLHEDLIDVERIAVATVSLFESTSVSSAKLDTPESNGFVADANASFGEQVFDISMAEIESMVEPNRVTDDVGRKSVTLISIHHQIIDQRQLTCQYPTETLKGTPNTSSTLQAQPFAFQPLPPRRPVAVSRHKRYRL